MMRGCLSRALIVLVSAGLFAVVAEIALRWQGVEPFDPPDVDLVFEPENSARSHPRYGYSLKPGTFTTHLGAHSSTATHSDHGTRLTRPVGENPPTGAPRIHIYGCSFTYGWSLNDHETYPWQLQRLLPNADVVNYGVGGFGTTQAYLQLEDHIASGNVPDIAIIAYGSFHDRRNTLLRIRRKSIVPFQKQRQEIESVLFPYAQIEDGELTIDRRPLTYREWPGMRWSALVHFLEIRANRLEARWADSTEVTRGLLEAIHQLATDNGIELVIAGIEQDPPTREVLQYCEGRGIPQVDISVDLTLPENNLLPHDTHPSGHANSIYAERLATYLEQLGLQMRRLL